MDVFLIPDERDEKDIIGYLSKHHILKNEQTLDSHFSFLDTHDWRIYKAGYRLELYNDHSALYLVQAIHPILKSPCHDRIASASDLDSLLAARIGPLLENRSLYPRAELECHSRGFEISDSRNQASVALTVDILHILNPARHTIRVIRFIPLLESKAEIENVQSTLLSLGLPITADSIFEQIFQSLNIEPGGYSSKVFPDINKKMSCPKAAAVIFRQLFGVTDSNINGIILDIDDEFLHDFRTSVRRTRSALSHLRDQLPESSFKHFRKEFRFLGKSTNKLRDLDVLLQSKDQIIAALPDILIPGLTLFFKSLQSRRKAEHKNLVKILSGKRFKELSKEWPAFIDQLFRMESDIPIKKVSDTLISNRYLQVLDQGNKLDEKSKKEDFHKLRIQCKKLRYALELFYQLYPSASLLKQIKILKSLQDHLGAMNDREVHIEFLAQEISSTPPLTGLTAAALGGVITHFAQDSKTLCRDFHKRWSVFSKMAARKQTQQLFSR